LSGREVDLTGARRYEALIRRPGGMRIADVSVSRLEERGHAAGLVAVARDVTRERLAAEALRRSERRFRALFNRAPLAIFTLDKDGAFIGANRAAFRLAGVTSPDPRARLQDFVIPADWPRVEGELPELLQEARDFLSSSAGGRGVRWPRCRVGRGARRRGEPIARDVTDGGAARWATHSEDGASARGPGHRAELNNRQPESAMNAGALDWGAADIAQG
jgi:PAS domain-containing protein